MEFLLPFLFRSPPVFPSALLGSVSPTTALGTALPVPGASTPGVAVSSGSAATTAGAATASSGLSVPTSKALLFALGH